MSDELENNSALTASQREVLERNAYKPGESGNPAGRPVGSRNRATVLKEILGLRIRSEKEGVPINPFDKTETEITVEKAVNIALIKEAMAGDTTAIAQILDTAYGKLTDKRQQLGKDEQPIDPEIRVRIIDAGHRDD